LDAFDYVQDAIFGHVRTGPDLCLLT